jgi:hypothetical protein
MSGDIETESGALRRRPLARWTRLALLVGFGMASIWLGAALTLSAFDVWTLGRPGGQKDFGEFVLGGLLLAASAGLATAWACAILRRSHRR